jgi:hypothetical protein
MKRFLMAFALMCVLSLSAFAGDVPMTSPVPGDVGTPGAPASGDMGNGGIALMILDLLF